MTSNAKHIYPAFVESIQEVFETMVFMPADSLAPLKKEHKEPKGGIAGSLSITCDELTINLSLVFGNELATSVFKAMMGMEEEDEVTVEEVSDIVGELGNMTCGGAKTRLEEEYKNLQLGLPSVVVGTELYIEPPKDAETVVVPLQTEHGTFFLEISVSGR
ncbi:MAG: hypothetical protein EOL87_16525 [Spartobacteria bacterium]|nr:hypothetical protein [Spartobacteria bacterium]